MQEELGVLQNEHQSHSSREKELEARLKASEQELKEMKGVTDDREALQSKSHVLQSKLNSEF